MAVEIQWQVRRDTAANWTSNNPTMLAGELGYETDTGYVKIGDGTTAWTSLSYDWSFGNDVTAVGAVTGSNLSGANTGDQTSIVGITGTTAEFNTALSDGSFATGGGTATGTNTGDQTSIVGITGTTAEFNTALSDGSFATGGGTATGTNTGDQTITLTGDVTGSGTGSFAATIAANAVTNAKLNTMAANTAKVNATAGTATPTNLSIGTNTVLGRAGGNIVAAQVVAGQIGTNAVTSDKINAAAVTNAKLADMAQSTFKGRASGAGTGVPVNLTATEATAILDTFTSGLKGLAPSSGGGTTNFLRADGTWAAPAGGGGGDVTKVGTPVDNEIGVWTGDGTLEGDSNLTWDGSILDMSGNILLDSLDQIQWGSSIHRITFDDSTDTFSFFINNNEEFSLSPTSADLNLPLTVTGGQITVDGTAPATWWVENDAGPDQGYWRFVAAGEDFFGQLWDDAQTNSYTWLQIARSGTGASVTVDSMSLRSPVFDFGPADASALDAQLAANAGATGDAWYRMEQNGTLRGYLVYADGANNIQLNSQATEIEFWPNNALALTLATSGIATFENDIIVQGSDFTLGTADTNSAIMQRGRTDASLVISAGTGVNNSAQMIMYGSTHGTQAFDWVLKRGGSTLSHFDDSTGIWTFSSGAAGTLDVFLTADASQDVTFAGAVTVTGTFTSPGIDDNATAERFQLADSLATWGVSGAQWTHAHATNVNSHSFTGGNASGSGAEMLVYGGSHGSLPGDMYLRSDGNTFFSWDESAGLMSFNTGAGSKTLAMSINSAGLVDIDSGNLQLGVVDTTPGLLRLYGDATTSTVGGRIILENADDHDATSNSWSLYSQSGTFTIVQDGVTTPLTIDTNGDFTMDGTVKSLDGLRFDERADHNFTPTGTFGELWLKNSTPNALMFTDDAGTDHDLTLIGTGDVSSFGTPVNNEVAVWTDSSTIEGASTVTWDGVTFDIGGHLDLNDTGALSFGDGNEFIRGFNTGIIESFVNNTRIVEWRDNGTDIGQELFAGGLRLNERSDHGYTSGIAAKGEIWVENTASQLLKFSDDAGVDRDIGTRVYLAENDTLSSASHDLTGIRSHVQKITLIFHDVSSTSSSNIRIRIGDSGGIEPASYTGAVSRDDGNSTATTGGFDLDYTTVTSGQAVVGTMVIERMSATLWVASWVTAHTTTAVTMTGAGTKTLTAQLDRVQIINSAGTFDGNSSWTVYYE